MLGECRWVSGVAQLCIETEMVGQITCICNDDQNIGINLTEIVV